MIGPELELGPAVTDEFAASAVLGVHELVAGRRPERVGGGGTDGASPTASAPASGSPSAPDAPPITPAKVELDPRVLQKSLEMLDAMISAFAGVEREPPDVIEPLAASIKPLADYYASDTPGVTLLWIMASLGIGSYALTKWQRYRVAHPSRPKSPATPSGVETAELATSPSDLGA